MQANHIVHNMPLVSLFNPGIGVAPLVEGSQAVQVGMMHEENRIISSQL